MKKFTLFSTLCFCTTFLLAQNVGIGTPTPIAKLSIQGAENTFNGLATGIVMTNTAPGGGSWYLRSGATGTSTPPGGFSIGNNSDYVFALNNNGYLGLLTVDPQERLHLAYGNIRLDASDKGIQLNASDRPLVTRGFDPFTSGIYNGLGRWGIFMEPSRLTMGIPNLTGKAFEVAKYNLNGTHSALFGVDVNGALQLAGNTGTSGQVLVSNGTAAAAWQTISSSSENNVRFEASFIESANNMLSPPLTYTSYYNFNTTAVTIDAAAITINQSGLYHIEGYSEIEYEFTGAPAYFTQEFVSSLDRNFVESRREPLIRDLLNPSNFRYLNYGKFSREVYIIAPATISCGYSNGYNAGGVSLTSVFHRGRISGYLISQ